MVMRWLQTTHCLLPSAANDETSTAQRSVLFEDLVVMGMTYATPWSLRFEKITTGRLLPNSGFLRSFGNSQIWICLLSLIETSFPFILQGLSKGLRRVRYFIEVGKSLSIRTA